MVNDDFCSSARPAGQLLDRFQVLRLNSLIQSRSLLHGSPELTDTFGDCKHLSTWLPAISN